MIGIEHDVLSDVILVETAVKKLPLITLLLVTLCGCTSRRVVDYTATRPRYCEIHGRYMRIGYVEMLFGRRMSTSMDRARPELFPHAHEPLATWFCIPTREKYARVFLCSACTSARARYLKELPNANHVEVAMRFCPGEEIQVAWKQHYRAQVYDRGRSWNVDYSFAESENAYPNRPVRAYLKCLGTNTNLGGLFPGLDIEIREDSRKVADARVVQLLTAEQLDRRLVSAAAWDPR